MSEHAKNEQDLLKKYFEEDQLRWDEKTIADFSVGDESPHLVIFPQDYEQVQTAVKLARKLKKSVYVCGNNRLRDRWAQPNHFDWAISTSKLNQIISHDSADFTVTLQAGVLLTDIQQQLGRKNQFLPLDPFDGDQQTIGGIVAANLNGSYRFHFGTCQDLILGMKIILPDGRFIKTGGKTVKNVAGYNLSRLFTGSMGTLGVIAEMTLKLSPVPPYQRTTLIGFKESARAAQAAHFIRSSNMVFDRLDFLNDIFVDTLQIDKSKINPKSKYFLLLSASGNEKAINHSIQRMHDEIAGWTTIFTFPENKDAAKIWKELTASGFQHAMGKTDFWLQLIAPKAKVWRLVPELEAIFPDSFLHGFAGNGVINIFFKLPQHSHPAEMKKAIENFRRICADENGHVVGMKVPAEYRDAAIVWGSTNILLPLMNSVKRKLDPDKIMVSGRYFGGI